jgi:helix-turn-helix protein
LSSSADNRERRVQTHRLAVTRAEAARALGVSINSFERHVQPELKIVRRGKLRLIPVREIERWLEENAEWTLGAP